MSGHYRILPISTQLVMQWASEGRAILKAIERPLPDDCRIVDCQMDFRTPNTILLKLESAEFDPVPDGEPIPEVESPIFHRA